MSAAPVLDILPPPSHRLGILYLTLARVWLGGTALLLAWLGLCQCHLLRLRRGGHIIATGDTAGMLAPLCASLGVSPPHLVASPHVRSPFLAGVLRPAVFLPASFETEFDPAARLAILAHELAHLRRHDCSWTLLARLVCAALWMQPFAWLLSRKLEQASEEVCDLAVLAQDCAPRAYADCLLTLAERFLPSRPERTVGAGVVPFRSTLGQRIQNILNGSHQIISISRRARVGITIGALFSMCAILLVFGAKAYDVPHFDWAKQQGWSVQPITVLPLENMSQSQLSRLPYDMTEQDKDLLKQCYRTGGTVNYGGSPGPPVSNKQQLEILLASHPHSFYVEYLLAIWFYQHSDAQRYKTLMSQALHDAPTVLAGRCEYDNGDPLADFELSILFECYSPLHLNAKDGTYLDYPVLITDKDGCYYIPIYRGVYTQMGWSYYAKDWDKVVRNHFSNGATLMQPGPSTSTTNFSRLLQGFVSEERVGILHPMYARPYLEVTSPFSKESGEDKPLPIDSNSLDLSWQSFPGAVKYRVTLHEWHPTPHLTMVMPIWIDDPHFREGSPETKLNLQLSGNRPVFNRRLSYSVQVEPLDRNGEAISISKTYYFQPLAGLAPQPLTKAAFAQVVGPGTTVTAITYEHGKVIISGTTSPETGKRWQREDERTVGKLFGLELERGGIGNGSADAPTFHLVFRQ